MEKRVIIKRDNKNARDATEKLDRPSTPQDFDPLRDLFKELEIAKKEAGELISKQDVNQLKQHMSREFRTGGYIQLLSEEKYTFATMDLTLAHPTLRNEYLNMLRGDIPEARRLSPPYIRLQTARAFQYAQEYLHSLWASGASPSQ